MDGQIDLLVGTHALIEGTVQFKKLGLVVIDEQHRFGVVQRMKLKEKGTSPDVLIMTATPIPPHPFPYPLRRPGRFDHRRNAARTSPH